MIEPLFERGLQGLEAWTLGTSLVLYSFSAIFKILAGEDGLAVSEQRNIHGWPQTVEHPNIPSDYLYMLV